MQDHPSSAQILDCVIDHLRERVLPGLTGRAVFELRVTLSALQLVRRSLDLTPQSDAAERQRLKALLGEEADLDALNRILCGRIRAGDMDPRAPGLLEHLRATALEKLAVDQPGYSAYRRAMEDRKA